MKRSVGKAFADPKKRASKRRQFDAYKALLKKSGQAAKDTAAQLMNLDQEFATFSVEYDGLFIKLIFMLFELVNF